MSTIRERNKELILRAASEEFADKGFAATKTSDIAAKASCIANPMARPMRICSPVRTRLRQVKSSGAV